MANPPNTPQRTQLASGDRWFGECAPGRLEQVFVDPGATVEDLSTAPARHVRLTDGGAITIAADRLLLCAKAQPPAPGQQPALPEFDADNRPRSAASGHDNRHRPGVGHEGPGLGLTVEALNNLSRRLDFTPARLATSPAAAVPPTPFAIITAEATHQGNEAGQPPNPEVNVLPDDLPIAMVPGDALAQLQYGQLARRTEQDKALLLWFAACYVPTATEAMPFQVWWHSKALAIVGDFTKLTGVPRTLMDHANRIFCDRLAAVLTPGGGRETRQERGVREAEHAREEGESVRTSDAPGLRGQSGDLDWRQVVMRRPHNEVPPPVGLQGGVTPGGSICIAYNSRDPANYPPCFDAYKGAGPADKEQLQQDWAEALRNASKHTKRLTRAQAASAPMEHLQGLVEEAETCMAMANMPSVVIRAVSRYGQMEAILASRLMDPALWVKVQRWLPESVEGEDSQPEELTMRKLQEAWARELVPKRENYDHILKLRSAFRDAKVTLDQGKVGDGEALFVERFGVFAAHVGFADDDVRQWRMIHEYALAIPVEVYKRVVNAMKGRGDYLPDSWKEMTELVFGAFEQCRSQRKDAAEAAAAAAGKRPGDKAPGGGGYPSKWQKSVNQPRGGGRAPRGGGSGRGDQPKQDDPKSGGGSNPRGGHGGGRRGGRGGRGRGGRN